MRVASRYSSSTRSTRRTITLSLGGLASSALVPAGYQTESWTQLGSAARTGTHHRVVKTKRHLTRGCVRCCLLGGGLRASPDHRAAATRAVCCGNTADAV